jgi:hypothetical protein
MTAQPTMDRNRLAAFVDGELSPEEAAAVVMHLADHPADQAFVDDLFAANAALAAAFAAPLSEPVPPALQTVLDGKAAPAQIIPLRARPRTAFMAGGLALAASLVAAVVLFRPAEPSNLALGPVAAGSPLAQALDTLPSGTPIAAADGRDLMILATLPTDTGHCREVEAINRAAAQIELALACHDAGSGWRVEVVLKEPLPTADGQDGFVTADGAAAQGLSPFLDQRGAGLALSPEAEADMIAKGWAP